MKSKAIKIILFLFSCMLMGCKNDSSIEQSTSSKEGTDNYSVSMGAREEGIPKTKTSEEGSNSSAAKEKELKTDEWITDTSAQEVRIKEVDWADYFKGQNGTAVFYIPEEKEYRIYNKTLADTRRSPCSTFKIISSLVGLETGVIDPENNLRTWSKETFWNTAWNQDLSFEEAFRSSCVWYFREVTNEIGKDAFLEELNRLSYGNCDISDWEGRENTNNNNRALTGFWIESSLKISPKEQTQVLERIFLQSAPYKQESLEKLKEVMLVTDQERPNIPVYGKTGMGKENGITVDAWYTGFTETEMGNVYFCVYLSQNPEMEVTSKAAKEIAFQLIEELF